MADPTSSLRPRLLLVLLATLLAGSLALRLTSAAHHLNPGRFFDERYTFQNVEAVLRHGQLRPANGFYLALSYLPQSALLAASEALHRATGIGAFGVWHPDGVRFSATAYLICRTLNVLVGTASLWLTFLIGRRLWSPSAGLLAAAALATAPRHLRCSVEYKPDIWVVLFTLLAFWWALVAAERPARRRFLRAGIATGLALSAKYTGIGAALPVAVAGLARGGWRSARRWGWLVLSGCTALATYLLLNPHLGLILPYVPRVMAGYVRQSRRQGLSHSTLMLREVRFLADNLGAIVFALALLGIALLLWQALRRRGGDGTARLAMTMLLVQIIGYSLFYASATPLFRGQNYLPVVPFAALLAAYAATRLASLSAVAAPALARFAPAGVALLVTLSLADQARAVYVERVPTTWHAAGTLVSHRLAEPAGRQLAQEPGEGRLELRSSPRPVVILAPSLLDVPRELLDGADAEAFPSARLAGAAGGAYRRRLEATPLAGRHEVRAALFAVRGEAITVLLHPWTPAAPAAWLPADARGRIALPATAPGELLAVELELRRQRGPSPPGTRELRLPDGRVLPLQAVGRRPQLLWLQSARFALPAASEAQLVGPDVPRRVLRWRVVRWQRADVD